MSLEYLILPGAGLNAAEVEEALSKSKLYAFFKDFLAANAGELENIMIDVSKTESSRVMQIFFFDTCKEEVLFDELPLNLNGLLCDELVLRAEHIGRRYLAHSGFKRAVTLNAEGFFYGNYKEVKDAWDDAIVGNIANPDMRKAVRNAISDFNLAISRLYAKEGSAFDKPFKEHLYVNLHNINYLLEQMA